MVGALNKLPVAASGILFMGDPATMGNVLGILFGFIAGLLYSYSKTEQAQQNFATQATGSSLSANNSSASKVSLLSEQEGSNADGSVIELTAPSNLPSKTTTLPLYKPNPDGKSAD